MAVTIITPSDLTIYDVGNWTEPQLQGLIEDAMADVAVDAPCLLAVDAEGNPTAPPAYLAKAKSIIRQAILRRIEGGFGTRTTETVSFDGIAHTQGTQVSGSRVLLFPHEIDKLKELCSRLSGTRAHRAGSVDMFDATAVSEATIIY